MKKRSRSGEHDVASLLHGDPAITVTLCHPAALGMFSQMFLILVCMLILGSIIAWMVILHRLMRPVMRRETQRIAKEGTTHQLPNQRTGLVR